MVLINMNDANDLCLLYCIMLQANIIVWAFLYNKWFTILLLSYKHNNNNISIDCGNVEWDATGKIIIIKFDSGLTKCVWWDYP